MSFRVGLALTSLFVVSLLAAAQSNSLRVEGTILNNVTGEPVPRAEVRLQGPSSYTQSSDDQGKFVFDNVAPGIYGLGAQRNGFNVVGGYLVPVRLNVSKGQSLDKLEIKLIPGGVVAGRVIDEAGKPMVQTQVLWFRYAYVQGKKQLQRRGNGLAVSQTQTMTNDKGEFRFADLPPGEYFVVANVPLPTVRADSGSQERNVTTFYPSVIDPAAAVPVRMTAGAEFRDMDIHVRRTTVHSIRGKVVGSASSAQVRLFLTRTDGVPAGQGTAPVRPDGSFEFPYVVTGSYALRAQSGGSGVLGSTVPCVGCSNLRVTNRDLDDLTLQLDPVPVVGINGTIRAEAQALSQSRVFVALTDVDEDRQLTVGPVNADGAFKIPPGASKYSWRVDGFPPGTYVKSARFNNQDVTNKLIDSTKLGGGTLEIVVSSKSADLAGSVVDVRGALKARVRVTLWLKTEDPSNTNGGVYETASDQNGDFRFSGIAPGNYYTAAWEETMPPGLGTYLEFLSRFNGDATAVTLEESGQASKNAKFISAQRIAAEIARLP